MQWLIKDLETNQFEIWTDAQVKIYRADVDAVGAAPSISEIAEFDETTQQLYPSPSPKEKELREALEGLVNDVKSKPNDTRYSTAIKKATEALKQ